MDPANSQRFSCYLLLDKVEANIVKIIDNHEKYNFHWYNLSSQGKGSFQELLNIPNEIYVQVFLSLQIFVEN